MTALWIALGVALAANAAWWRWADGAVARRGTLARLLLAIFVASQPLILAVGIAEELGNLPVVLPRAAVMAALLWHALLLPLSGLLLLAALASRLFSARRQA